MPPPLFQKARRSLTLKIGSGVALVVLLTVALMSLYAYAQERRSAVQRELAALQAVSRGLEGRIDLALANGRTLPAHLANTRNVMDFLEPGGHGPAGQKAFLEWLDLQFRLTPGLSSIFLLSPTGECLASTNRFYIGHNYSFRPFFQDAMAGRPHLSDWTLGLLFGIPHLDASAPVRIRGRIAGVLVTEFPVDQIEQAVRETGVNGRSVVLVNRDGIALAHSNARQQYHALQPLDPAVLARLRRTRQFMGRDIPVDPHSRPWTEGLARARETRTMQTVTYRLDNAPRTAVLTPLAEQDWVVSVAIPHDAFLLPMRRAMVRTLLAGLAVALAGILAAWAVGRSLLGSIRRLSETMERFGAGDTGVRAPVLDQDERGQLSSAFNHMADALQAHQARLDDLRAQQLDSLRTLVAGIAHNLNNVLAIALGTVSLREDAAADPADREAYRTIDKVCRRGREVVKSLIHFAQPSVVARVPVDLNGLVREVCALLESTARDRTRIIEALAEEPLWVSGNYGDLNQVLVNLGINALEAMPGGGTLTLRTAVLEGDQVRVTVADSGPGMAPEVLAHALEPFYTTKEVGQGAGLGLSMAYGVTRAHGGTLQIASRPGQGTLVSLQFPRIPAPAGRGPAPSGQEPGPVPRKVFLVDDDEDVRFLMGRMLKQAGVGQVELFPGGEEVLARLPAGDLPDLVILDQNMPGMNGLQVMERIRALLPRMPILISSGQPDIEEWDCFRIPGVGVISKPFTMEEIQARLGRFGAEASLTSLPERRIL